MQRSGATATVYVSWNGATVHRRWQVLGGDAHDRLRPIGVHAVQGFETAIAVDHAPRWLAVRGLDEHDAELATSQAAGG